MEQNLTDEQVEKIVQMQLKRLEDDYQLTKSFDILCENQKLPQKIIQSEQIKENNNQSDKKEEGEEDNPYQLMGDDGDENNDMFSDEDQEQGQNTNFKKQEQQKQQENILYNIDQEVRIKQDIYKPQQTPIDAAKIVQIAQKMNIQTPDWAVEPTQFEKRIRELFGNSASK